jgi:hypothetical protein
MLENDVISRSSIKGIRNLFFFNTVVVMLILKYKVFLNIG